LTLPVAVIFTLFSKPLWVFFLGIFKKSLRHCRTALTENHRGDTI
jgi:hypothetical protein